MSVYAEKEQFDWSAFMEKYSDQSFFEIQLTEISGWF